MPTLDAAGNARILLRKYLWRAFFTNRYEFATGSAALNDYRYLRAVIAGDESSFSSIFDEDQYPLATVDEIKAAGWPKLRNTLARGILAVSLYAGARDFADESLATRNLLRKREYHHLFPEHLLAEDGRMKKSDIDSALNCALITWNTNRRIAAKAPIAYLRERSEGAPSGEDDVRRRLATHLIPFDALNIPEYSDLQNDAKSDAIHHDYNAFLEARAEWIKAAADALVAGQDIPRNQP